MSDPTENATKRLAFISHKHKDNELARCVSNFIKVLSGGTVDTFVASAPESERPKFGEPIEGSIKSALAQTGLVILVYTDPTDNWEWCLWECGVATDPRDSNPTRVVVFAFAGEAPEKYKSALNLNIDLQNTDIVDLLLSFAIDFCRSSDFWPDSRGPVNPNFDDASLRDLCVQHFHALKEVEPRDANRTREKLIDITDRMSAEVGDYLVKLVEKGERALTWGLSGNVHAGLFRELWDKVYVSDLRKLARKTLVFRPPSLVGFWEKLLALTLDNPDPSDQPTIRLVSGEADESLSFWWDAMNDPESDARSYETPVRETAQKLHQECRRNAVERRFLFSREFFRSDSNIQRFQKIVEWMNEAHITVSVGRRADVDEKRWLDFALVGRFAVSRFSSVDGLSSRVLEESFSSEEIDSAELKWDDSIKARWSSDDEVPLDEFLSHCEGVI